MSIKILRLLENKRGHDFVVGDLHGEISSLRRKLVRIGFDPTIDRLFSVGDLIDRGPDCLAALRLLEQPWFFAVQGNHEGYLVGCLLQGMSRKMWHAYGGQWADGIDDAELLSYAMMAAELPHLIVVGDGESRFHIVHANALYTTEQVDDKHQHAAIELETLQLKRSLHFKFFQFYRIHVARSLEKPPEERIDYRDSPEYRPIAVHVALTFCGHTPLPVTGLWMSHYMMDGGSGYREGELDWTPQLHVVNVNEVRDTFTTQLSRNI